MYCVGITGNIASGKTTASQYFANLGINVISADKIAHIITESDPAIKQAIHNYFPDCVSSTGILDRHALRNIITTQIKKRQWLEQLLHPVIQKKIIHAISTTTSPYCVIEIPLLYNVN